MMAIACKGSQGQSKAGKGRQYQTKTGNESSDKQLHAMTCKGRQGQAKASNCRHSCHGGQWQAGQALAGNGRQGRQTSKGWQWHAMACKGMQGMQGQAMPGKGRQGQVCASKGRQGRQGRQGQARAGKGRHRQVRTSNGRQGRPGRPTRCPKIRNHSSIFLKHSLPWGSTGPNLGIDLRPPNPYIYRSKWAGGKKTIIFMQNAALSKSMKFRSGLG